MNYQKIINYLQQNIDWKIILFSKRTYIILGVIAANATGLLPHEWIDKIAALAVFGTKVIDSLNNK